MATLATADDRRGPRPRQIRLVAGVVGACAVAVLLSFLTKWQCTGPTFDAMGTSANFDRLKNTHFCYTDIQNLWAARGLGDHVFPYLHGVLENGQLYGGALEYPVLTGVFMWLTGLPAHNDAQFLFVSAVCLAPFGLLTARLLAGLTGRRALIWAAAPALVFYAVLNWDLLVTAAVALAVWSWWRGRPTLAAVWLGVGAAAKLYPVAFVLPLALERLSAGDRRGAARVVGAGVGTVVALNLPLALASPGGWWATYAFQADRPADITTNSIWYWGFPGLTPGTLTRLSVGLIAAAWVGALALGWWRARRGGQYPWVQVSAAMLCAFLLLNKVDSPQYMLWLLPFFVLVRVRWGWWVGYMACDALLFVGLFRWYDTLVTGGDYGLAKQAAIVGVWGRAAMLALLYVVFVFSPLALRPPRSGRDTPEGGGPRTDSTPGATPSADPVTPGEAPTDAPTATGANSDPDTGTDPGERGSRMSTSARSNTPPAGSSVRAAVGRAPSRAGSRGVRWGVRPATARTSSRGGGRAGLASRGPSARTTSRFGRRMSRITRPQ